MFRSVFVLPLTISLAAIGVIWTFVYNPNPDIGVLNAFLRLLHLDGRRGRCRLVLPAPG